MPYLTTTDLIVFVKLFHTTFPAQFLCSSLFFLTPYRPFPLLILFSLAASSARQLGQEEELGRGSEPHFTRAGRASCSWLQVTVTSAISPEVAMARDRDFDSASSASGQSKRPPLNHRESDTQSESSGLQQQQHHYHQPRRHQKHHHVGRFHSRAPAAKVTRDKAPKLNRRHTAPYEHQHYTNAQQHQSEATVTQPHPNSQSQSQLHSQTQTQTQAQTQTQSHRRASSEVKLPSREAPAAHLQKSPSHSSTLKRNRSHVEIGKRNRSTDKLKRSASNTVVYSIKPSKDKHQVHFDLGSEGQDDEWVDASGSNSPYLSRKGSFNSSGQSSLKPTASASSSRPVTPHDPPAAPAIPSPDRERAQHKEYLTSRLLQRVPSQGAPPKMTADLAQVAPVRFSPDSITERESTTLPNSNKDELTSRFVEAPGSGLTSLGSFYHPPPAGSRYDETPRRQLSTASIPQGQETNDAGSENDTVVDESVLIPKTARRSAAPPAETSRTQQKLNLQRASSVIEPGQAVGGVGGVVGATPLIGIGGPGFDGGHSRDPRVTKLLDRTGMEYLVVRRYQNSIARSLQRLNHLPNMDKTKRIPRANVASMNGKRSIELPQGRHVRNVSMPDPRRPGTSRASSVRLKSASSSYEGNDDDGRLNEGLSGSSLVGGEDEDGTAALLRNLWEKSMELGASTD